MDAAALKATQAPLKEKYRETPAAAAVTLKAEGRLGDGVTCGVETGRALVACAGVTLGAVATGLGLPLRDARVLAEGDLDFRGTLGVAKDAPVGFRALRLKFEVDGDLSEEQRATLIKLTERYCVVYQTLRQPPKIEVASTFS